MKMPETPESTEEGLSAFPLSEEMKEKLGALNITTLFPVQQKTLEHILAGTDVLCQARTGTGKTFAFAIPLCELYSDAKSRKKKDPPCILVLAPTRELAIQINTDFKSIASNRLHSVAIYGGAPIEKQIAKLAKGAAIVCGTPGRVIDLIGRGDLDISAVKHVVLDEVDRMLDMGFQADVEKILKIVFPADKINSSRSIKLDESDDEEEDYDDEENGDAEDTENSRPKPQMLLFSATMPEWVDNVASKFLGKNVKRFNLSDDSVNKTAETIKHLALECQKGDHACVISDLLRVYAADSESRAVVFCNQKIEADILACSSSMKLDCHVLHGGIPQAKREIILEKFREGKYTVIVTTNVFARGLDIPSVDLVIQISPPENFEDYIHRSGRTGRAGKEGTCICLFNKNQRVYLANIENNAGIKFQRISQPTPQDVADASSKDTLVAMENIPESAWSNYLNSADSIIESLGAQRAVACALAKMAGKVNESAVRSILSARQGFVAYRLDANKDIHKKRYAYDALKRSVPEASVETIKNLQFVVGKQSVVFDVPCDEVNTFDDHWRDGNFDKLSKLDELPELEVEEESSFSLDRRGKFNGHRGNTTRGTGNFRGRGRGSFRGGNNNFRGDNDNSRGGRGNFRGGRGNFRGGRSSFRGGRGNSRGGHGDRGMENGGFRGSFRDFDKGRKRSFEGPDKVSAKVIKFEE